MSRPWSRLFRLQWSLRTLLLLITLAAVSAAVATRWPYEVVEKRRDLLWQQDPSGFTDKQGNLSSTEERAIYRGLIPQYRVRHGKSELFLYNRSERLRLVERYYRNGVHHGSYREFYPYGRARTRTEGEYRFGLKHGKWLHYLQGDQAARNDCLLTERWDLGRPHGLWQWENGYGEVSLTTKYDQGRVVEVNGEAVIDWRHRLTLILPPDSLNVEWQRMLLEVGAATEVDRRPTMQASPWMFELIEREVRPRPLDEDIYYPAVRRVPREVHWAHALHVTNLAYTVRHNTIFLTTPDRVGPEHDPTGVSQLKPPAGSLLEQSLAAEVEISRWGEGQLNGRKALEYLRKHCGVPLDDSALHNTLVPRDEDRAWIKVSNNNAKYRVRDLLGLALFRLHCRCDLVEGNLVITRLP